MSSFWSELGVLLLAQGGRVKRLSEESLNSVSVGWTDGLFLETRDASA